MTDLVAAPLSASAVPSVRSISSPLGKFMPNVGMVTRVTLIAALAIFAAVAVSIFVSVQITKTEMYRRAQNNLAINIKLLDSILAGYGAPTRQGDKLYFG